MPSLPALPGTNSRTQNDTNEPNSYADGHGPQCNAAPSEPDHPDHDTSPLHNAGHLPKGTRGRDTPAKNTTNEPIAPAGKPLSGGILNYA